MRSLRSVLLSMSQASVVNCRAQSSSVPKTIANKVEQPSTPGHLAPVQSVVAASELANGFDEPLTCDNDGNLYLQSEHFGVSGVRKLNAKGERTALFQPNPNPEFRLDSVGYFASDQTASCMSLSFLTRSLAT
jgi:hypothetical protein